MAAVDKEAAVVRKAAVANREAELAGCPEEVVAATESPDNLPVRHRQGANLFRAARIAVAL